MVGWEGDYYRVPAGLSKDTHGAESEARPGISSCRFDDYPVWTQGRHLL
jgi:hypothetical protein